MALYNPNTLMIFSKNAKTKNLKRCVVLAKMLFVREFTAARFAAMKLAILEIPPCPLITRLTTYIKALMKDAVFFGN